MIATTEPVYLTDDEVVALGVRARLPWPSIVPTVITTDVQEVGRAAERGTRSLMARGLLAVDGVDRLHPALGKLLSPVLGGQMYAAAYATDGDAAYVPGTVMAFTYFEGAGSVTELTGPGGIRCLQSEGPEGADTRLLEVIEHCFESGASEMIPGQSDVGSEFVFVARRTANGVRSVLVSSGQIYEYVLPMGGASLVADRRQLSGVEAALVHLGLVVAR